MMSERRIWTRHGLALVTAGVAAAVLVACGDDTGAGGSADEAAAGVVAVDLAREAGIAETSTTHGEPCVADVDGDGHTDLILSNHEAPWDLYLGDGEGGFERSTALPLEPLDRHACAVADFDGNGRLDVYFSVGTCIGECQNPKELWLQQDDGGFVEQAATWGVADPSSRGRVAIVLDVDGDDRPDLFTGAAEAVDFPSRSRLWANRGGRFEEVPTPFTEAVANLCAAAADIDDDGDDDLAICTQEDGFVLYRNDGGTLVDATDEVGLESYGRRTVELADVDADGRPDLLTVGRGVAQIHRNEGGRFAPPVFSHEMTDGKDVAAGDADGDGDLDLYLQEGIESTDPDRILLNDGDGRSFATTVEVPDVEVGGGDTVAAVADWRGTGRAAFVVSNGFQDAPGPRQLIALDG